MADKTDTVAGVLGLSNDTTAKAYDTLLRNVRAPNDIEDLLNGDVSEFAGFLSQEQLDHLFDALSIPGKSLHEAAIFRILYVRRHKNLISPINRLPPELLATIFDWVIASEADWSLRPLHTLAQVSTYWRNVVVNSAILWRYISPQCGDYACKLKLTKSGNIPLIIDCVRPDSGHKFWGYNRDTADTMTRLASQGASRIEKFTCTPDQWSDFCRRRPISDAWVPRLRFLELVNGTKSIPPHTNVLIRELPDGLRHFKACGVSLNWKRSCALKNLASLSIYRGAPTAEIVFDTLIASPNLTKLELVSINSTGDPFFSPLTVHLPHLLGLTMKNVGKEFAATLLPAITAENIGRLSVSVPIAGNRVNAVLIAMFEQDGLIGAVVRRLQPETVVLQLRPTCLGLLAGDADQDGIFDNNGEIQRRCFGMKNREDDWPLAVGITFPEEAWSAEILATLASFVGAPQAPPLQLVLLSGLEALRSLPSFLALADYFPCLVQLDVPWCDILLAIIYYLSQPSTTASGAMSWPLSNLKKLVVTSVLNPEQVIALKAETQLLLQQRNTAGSEGCHKITVWNCWAEEI